MSGIFISYRRDDAAGEAGRLYDRLREHFGPDRVFRDVDALEPGQRFLEEIEKRLAGCDVVIALLGKNWRGEPHTGGRSRIDDPEDFVRLEIATALRRGVTVIPALLHNTVMPDADTLPPDLRPLASHHAIELDGAGFHDDVTRLIEILDRHVRPASPLARLSSQKRLRGAVGVAAVGAIALVATLPFFRGAQEISLQSEPRVLTAGEVRALIVERGFYSASTNPGATGLPTEYEAAVVEGIPVVGDDVTGLMWEQGGSGRLVQGGREGAALRIRELNEERLAGFADWRLPTVDEALSLMRLETTDEFHLDPVFDARAAPFVWTADTWTAEDAGAPQRAWVVYYLDGYAAPEVYGFNAYVRAVRTR